MLFRLRIPAQAAQDDRIAVESQFARHRAFGPEYGGDVPVGFSHLIWAPVCVQVEGRTGSWIGRSQAMRPYFLGPISQFGGDYRTETIVRFRRAVRPAYEAQSSYRICQVG